MSLNRSPVTTRIFRTEAWGNAWLDVWGNHKTVEIIDVGGRKNPREMLYRIPQKIKKIFPAHTLHLVGVASTHASAPRAEYNDIEGILAASGKGNGFLRELEKTSWSQFFLPDMVADSNSLFALKYMAKEVGWHIHEASTEAAYYVRAKSFNDYIHKLGANTRLAYVNRRERLRSLGTIEFVQFPEEKVFDFFQLLNRFHMLRWGRECYSLKSQTFFKNFIERLKEENGFAIMEAMQVSGETVSVLFDFVLDGCRYNFQSGYLENKFPKIALGALHMGYAIEAAIENQLVYDFMAGQGKHSNYKERISTHQEMLKSIVIERGTVKYIRHIKNLFN